MRLVACLLLLGLMPTVFAQTVGAPAESAWETLEACTQNEQSDAEGLEALEAECPGLQQALIDLGYAELLSESTQGTLTLDKLAELESVAVRYRESRPGSIEVESLHGVLDQIDQETVQREPTLWERLRTWLRKVFGRQAQDEEAPWLARWLDKLTLPKTLGEVLLYASLALIIVLALGVIINELRVAGVLRRGSARATEAGSSANRTHDEIVSLADLESVPLKDRPSLLLRVLIATLTKTGRLPSSKSLTHRELASRVAFEIDAQRETFRRVATMAERSLYGSAVPRPEEIESVVEEGRNLDSKLRGANA